MRKFICALAIAASAFVAQADEVSLKVEGMTCSVGCVGKVNKALSSVKGVSAKKVELGKAAVTFDASKTSQKEIAAAISKAGFTVKQ